MNSKNQKSPFKVSVISHKKTILATEGDNLSDKIRESGINLNNYCEKKGLCGKCRIDILSEKQKKTTQLACTYTVTKNLSVNIPADSIVDKVYGLKTGIKTAIDFDPIVKKYHFTFQRPTLSHPYSLFEGILHALGNKKLSYSSELLAEIPATLANDRDNFTVSILEKKDIIAIEPGNTTNHNYGIAIDIGTTTVAVELIDLNTGISLDSIFASNKQLTRGADVITRIGYALQAPENSLELMNLVKSTVSKLITDLAARNKISTSYIYALVLAGNTVMNHLFLGVPVDSLAKTPFVPAFTHFPMTLAKNLELPVNPNARVFIVPNIKSFVGGDITSGLCASSLLSWEGNLLFIDLGTNGEIVLKKGNSFFTTSTAAGPAFEGMNISCGMLAQPGAIFKVKEDKKLKISTIKSQPASGICGTGLIDLIALYLKQGKISASGKIHEKHKKIFIRNNIFLTQKDIREVQLAVAAVKTGIQMMLDKINLSCEQIDKIFIAGAFGNYLNIANSIRIGLLPSIKKDKILFLGNSSLAGARTMLLSRESKTNINGILKKIKYISLASDPTFQDRFINALEFKPY